MKKLVKILMIIAFGIILSFALIGCDDSDDSFGGGSGGDTGGGSGDQTPPALTGFVSISGNAQVGQTLMANTNTLGGSGAISYQWRRGETSIGTNSNIYTVQVADVGSTITVTVTRSGNSGSITSAPTGIIVNIGENQNPVASDFNIGNLTQIVGSVTSVTISPQSGKSTGTITILYDGSTTLPTAVGSYAVTFNVTASTGWNAANGLIAGTLTINTANQNPVASDYIIGNLIQTVGSVIPVTITPQAGKSTGTITILYNGSTTLPTFVGSYTVTFNVAATTGWNAAWGLAGGTLIIGINTGIEIGNPSIRLYMDGNPLTHGGTTTFNHGLGIININFSVYAETGNDPINLLPGRWFEGFIALNTSVWFSFAITSGTTYRIWVDDWFGGSGGIVSTYAQYENGTPISMSYNWFDGSQQFIAEQTSVVLIRVQPQEYLNAAGIFRIVYTANNSTRPAGTEGYEDIIWYLNGNIAAQGASRTSFTLSRQIPGTYQVMVEATSIDGVKNSGFHNFIIQ
jgi:hypothetical protein